VHGIAPWSDARSRPQAGKRVDYAPGNAQNAAARPTNGESRRAADGASGRVEAPAAAHGGPGEPEAGDEQGPGLRLRGRTAREVLAVGREVGDLVVAEAVGPRPDVEAELAGVDRRAVRQRVARDGGADHVAVDRDGADPLARLAGEVVHRPRAVRLEDDGGGGVDALADQGIGRQVTLGVRETPIVVLGLEEVDRRAGVDAPDVEAG